MQWVFRTTCDRKIFSQENGSHRLSQPSYVVVSNFEAENLSQYLNFSLPQQRLNSNSPKLYSFISLIRNEQRTQHLKVSSLGHVPASLHLLAGSIHAEQVNLTQ